jgi:hypothetical protein
VLGASIAVYRESDWQDHLRWSAREAGTPYDPAARFLGGYGNVLDFGLLIDPGELLERPHQHAWVVPDQAAAAAAARQIAELLVQRLLPALAELAALLPNRRLGLRHWPALVVREKAWLRPDEVCPWAPCGEPFRTVGAGGLWPPRGR